MAISALFFCIFISPMHFLCYNWLNLDGHVHPYPLGRPCSQNITDKAPVVSKHAHPEGNRAGWLSAQHHILCSPQGFFIHLVLHTHPIAARMEWSYFSSKHLAASEVVCHTQGPPTGHHTCKQQGHALASRQTRDTAVVQTCKQPSR